MKNPPLFLKSFFSSPFFKEGAETMNIKLKNSLQPEYPVSLQLYLPSLCFILYCMLLQGYEKLRGVKSFLFNFQFKAILLVFYSFLNTALQQSTVRLTWDEDDPKRLQNTMRKFTREDLENMDFKDYIGEFHYSFFQFSPFTRLFHKN